jgi:hypothetical protein
MDMEKCMLNGYMVFTLTSKEKNVLKCIVISRKSVCLHKIDLYSPKIAFESLLTVI